MAKKRVKRKKIKQTFTKSKFNLAFRDLILFAVLFFVFLILRNFVATGIWHNLFLLLMIIFGFLAIAFLLVFLIFIFAKWIKK